MVVSNKPSPPVATTLGHGMHLFGYSYHQDAANIVALRHDSAVSLAFCRRLLQVSQKLQSKVCIIFAHLPKSPYLCQRKQAITPVTAKTRSLTIKNYKIMTQMNEMSARALTMEELENVNGGVRITTGGGRCIRRPKNK